MKQIYLLVICIFQNYFVFRDNALFLLTFQSRPSNKKMIYFSLENNNYYAINLNKAWNATRHFACNIFSIPFGNTYFMFFTISSAMLFVCGLFLFDRCAWC